MPTPRIPQPYSAPFTLQDVIADGGKRGRLRGWLERNDIVQLHPGVFAPAAHPELPNWRIVFSSRAVTNGEAPVSVLGAATLHDLPVPPSVRAALARPAQTETAGVNLEKRGRLLVPSAEWTALQLARWQKLPGALIPVDAALAKGITRDALSAQANAMQQWPGTRNLPRAVAVGDGRAASPLESLSRGHMLVHGIPTPELQRRFVIRGNEYFVDFFWPQVGVIGEADGLGKYADREEIAREKHRQSQLQSLGYRLYRWRWADVHPDPRRWLHGLDAVTRGRRAA